MKDRSCHAVKPAGWAFGGWLLLAVAGGCCCGWGFRSPETVPPVCFEYYGTPLCYGFYSTCWRPWPEECPPCPPFTQLPSAETLTPPPMPAPPAPSAALPEPHPAPPPPAAAPMPVPMPQGAMPQGSTPALGSTTPIPGKPASLRRTWTEAHFTGQPLR